MIPLRTLRAIVAVVLIALGLSSVMAQPAKAPPDLAEIKYGPHARHVLDLWQAKSATPTPLVVFIHGGGFRQGSKENLSPTLLRKLLANGISVMSINYRFSPEVAFPAHHLDSARAIQFARAKAREWNIDPARIGASGSSAGAGMSLWIGFHDDLADPKSADLVLRQSTRLSCMAVLGAQSSYDPRVIREWVGEPAARHPALEGFYGIPAAQRDSPEAYKKYEAASAITYLTKDDPPVYAFYSEGRVIAPKAKDGAGIHHINFGLKLKEKMDALGIECTVRHRDEGARSDDEMVAFFRKHLRAGGDSAKK